jgi:VCBS repeat-containing protein
MPDIDAEFTLSLHADRIVDQGTIELIIHNFGQTAQIYYVYAHHSGELVQFTPESQHIPIGPHAEEEVSIWVQPKERDWGDVTSWLQTATYTCEMVVTDDDGRSRSEQAHLVVEPPLSPVALAGMTLVLFLVCLTFILLYALNSRAAAERDFITQLMATPQTTSQPTSIIVVTAIIDDDTDTPRITEEVTQPGPTNTAVPTATPLPLAPTATPLSEPVVVLPVPEPVGQIIVVDDTYQTITNSPLTVSASRGVLANDSSIDAGILTVLLGETSQAAHGSVTMNADGSFTYTPDQDYFGMDGFSYVACGRDNVCDAGLVTIAVYSRLVAADTTIIFAEDDGGRDITADIVSNDGDRENTPVTIIAVNDADPGRVTFNSQTGAVRYDPGDHFIYLGEGETATDTFRYTIRNTRQLSDTAVVNITIRGQNNPPVANDNQISLPAGRQSDSLTNLLLANDTDPDTSDQSRLIIHAVSNSDSGGSATLVNGEVYYDPGTFYDSLTPGQTATDTFTYTVADPQGATSNPATVQVTIQGVNEPPVLTITNLTSPVPFSATVGSVAIAETVVIDDPDSPSMTGIWVEFTGTNPRPDGQAEYLQITFQGSTITGTNNFIFIWTDPQPTQAYVDALQTIQYVNNRATPTAGCRQISFQVTDDRDRTSNVERVYVQVNGGTCPTAGVPSIQSMAGLPDHHRSIQ